MSDRRDGVPETIRISQSDYDNMVETAKKVKEYAIASEEEGRVVFDPSMFPFSGELEEQGVKYNMRKYAPYLVFYREPGICELDDPELEKTRDYIEELFRKYVMIMEDDDCMGIRQMDPDKWKDMSFEKRCDVLEPMILYYRPHEFTTFMRDMGWLPFMKYYRYSEKSYKEGKKNSRLEKDMKAIWNSICE